MTKIIRKQSTRVRPIRVVRTIRRRTQAERSEATRNLILDATVDVLARKGMAGLRMEDVEKTAAVSRGALLHHFGTKAALLLATFERLNESALEKSRHRTRFAS